MRTSSLQKLSTTRNNIHSSFTSIGTPSHLLIYTVTWSSRLKIMLQIKELQLIQRLEKDQVNTHHSIKTVETLVCEIPRSVVSHLYHNHRGHRSESLAGLCRLSGSLYVGLLPHDWLNGWLHKWADVTMFLLKWIVSKSDNTRQV